MTRPTHPIARPLSLALAATVAAALALATPAAAATPAPILDETPEAPTVVPDSLVGKLGTMPSAGARAATGTMTGKRDRRGLGLPAYKQLLGKGWKGTAAKADRRFAKKLDASESLPESGSAPGQGRRVDPVAEFDRLFRVKDVVRGRGGKQQRDLRVAATLDGGCPTLNSLGTGFNWSGTGRAVYEVRTTERAGRFDLVTAVVLDGHFRARPSMLPTAVADDFHIADFGEIAIARNQIAIDRRTGRRHRVGETERFTSTIGPDYRPEGGFEAFIASQEDGAPAPRRPLRSAVWDEMAVNFMAIPYMAMRSRVLDAEAYAQTPNRCVRVSVDAPSQLAPGATIQLTGVPTLPQDPGLQPFPILDNSDRVRAYWINEQGQQAKPLGKMHQLAGGAPWYEYKAPPAPWPDSRPAGIELELLSGAGVASTDVTFKAEAPSLHFEVLDASIETHTTASTGSILCGEVGGTRSFGGTHHPTAFDPQNRLEYGPDGQASGKVSGKINARWYDQTVFGCRDNGEELEPCERSMPDETPTSGTWDVWVAFAPANDPHEVVLDWALGDPDVGYIDAGNEECFAYVTGDVDNEASRQTVPRSLLQSGEPIELTLAGSVHLDTHGGFQPASIDYDYSYSLTIRRVAADGSPLP